MVSIEWQPRSFEETSERMLRLTDQSIPGIAQACGYQALSSFHRRFRDRYGCPASAYRKRLAKVG